MNCSNCKGDFDTSKLYWADKGGLQFLCLDCFNAEGLALQKWEASK
jgi:hypothetical protein